MKAETIGRLVFTVALLFLAFVAGAMLILSDAAPSAFLRDAYRAGTALFQQRVRETDPLKTSFWQPARTDQRGVTVYDRDQTFPGYTLYTSADGSYARLVTMDGELVHEWHQPYSSVWNEQAAVKDPQADNMVYMRKVRLFPNGDLLAIYVAAYDTPWGYGMVKLDSDSNVIWSYLGGQTHHDFDIGTDGRIYALTHQFSSADIEGLDYLDKPYLEDFLVILSPDGEELRKISLLKVLAQSDYTEALWNATPFFARGDPLHTNAVEVIEADKADVFPFGEPGDLLISFRQIGLIAVFDVEQEKIVWATLGPWLAQHDPSVLENGDILLYDNLGDFKDHNRSRALQFDPENVAITWSYPGSEEHPLDSKIRSVVQRLPNGNTLITESDGGRLLEVTAAGELVWEYLNPVRGGNSDAMIPVLSSGQRIDPGSLTPDFRATLKPAE